VNFWKKLFGENTVSTKPATTSESHEPGSSAKLSREWKGFFDSVRLHPRSHALASIVGKWPNRVPPARLTHSNWIATVRRVNDFLAMPYPVESIRRLMPDAKPTYKIVGDGKMGRESNPFLDMMICAVLPKGQPLSDQPSVLVWRLIEYYSRWPLSRLIFLLPEFDRVSQAATNSSDLCIVAEHVFSYIYIGVENALFAAWEALPERGRLSDAVIQQELMKLI
jgi:hypothetical protein